MLCRSSLNVPPQIIDPIYFSLTVLTDLGTGDISLAREAVLVRFMIISEVLIGPYFWAVLVGIIIAWAARESKY